MIQLREKGTGRDLGPITESDLQFLIDQLVEESSDDQDYYLTRDTLAFLRENGGPEPLMKLLEVALGMSDDIEIEWVRL